MRDGYRLIGFFDSFCNLHGINYFAIANTLTAAVAYKDFIPGSARIEIGMLRHDYLALESAHMEITAKSNSNSINKKVNPAGFQLISQLDETPNARRRLPIALLCEPEIVTIDGITYYDTKHMPLVGNAKIYISVFDAVPNDYDLSHTLFFKLRKLNRAFEKAPISLKSQISKQIWALAGSFNNRPHDYVARLMPTRSKSVLIKDLLPTRKLPFGPVEISVPNNTRTWVYENAESQAKQVAILQQDALQIALEIDRICRKHNIGYFICGGSMLGFVRHGGFIPWDDDMDVGMLREDYERFMKIAAEELGEEYFLQTRETDPNIPYLFSKVRLKDSEYITAYNELRDFNKGICVDIFPFDKVPLEYGTLLEHKTTIDALSKAHNRIVNRQVPDSLPNEDAKNLAESLEKAVMQARHKFFWSQSLTKTQAAYNEAVTAYNNDERLHYVASFVPSFTIVHLDDLLPYQDVEFEGHMLKAPAKPEVFLQMQYGDFMTLPMPHQQRGHGLLRWRDKNHSSEDFE